MTYQESLDAFTAAAKSCGIDWEVFVPSSGEDRDLLSKVFDGDLSADISANGYVGGAEIPWTAEEFSLYRFGDLEARQAGYRTDGRTGAVSQAWDQDRYVIGDWSGNPVSIDRNGSISYSRHGMGTWRYVQIAKDLATFLGALSKWMAFFIVENKKNIFDADFEVTEGSMMRIRQHVLHGLNDEEKDAFVKFLIG